MAVVAGTGQNLALDSQTQAAAVQAVGMTGSFQACQLGPTARGLSGPNLE